jgi:hypothetical protein
MSSVVMSTYNTVADALVGIKKRKKNKDLAQYQPSDVDRVLFPKAQAQGSAQASSRSQSRSPDPSRPPRPFPPPDISTESFDTPRGLQVPRSEVHPASNRGGDSSRPSAFRPNLRGRAPAVVDISRLLDSALWINAPFIAAFPGTQTISTPATTSGCNCPRPNGVRSCLCPSSSVLTIQHRYTPEDSASLRSGLVQNILEHLRYLAGIPSMHASQTTGGADQLGRF